MTPGPFWTRDEIVRLLREDAARFGRSPCANDWRRAQYGRPQTETVCRRFGSWNKALRAARLPRNRTPGTKPWWTKQRIVEAMLDWLVRHSRWPTTGDWRIGDPLGRRPSTQVVRKRFGTWNEAKRAAGWTG